MNAGNEEEVSESFSFAFHFQNTIFIWYTRHFKYSCMRCSRTTENNNKQSDKKEIDILTNNQDKKCNSTKHFQGVQFFIQEDVYWEWSVSEYPESRIKPCRFKPEVLSHLRRVCYFSKRSPGKNIAQSFLLTNNRITKLFLRTFSFVAARKCLKTFWVLY